MNRIEYEIMHSIERKYWWFRGKRFLINMLLRIYLGVSKNNKLLDIGCGTGMILDLLNNYGIGYGVELSSLAINILREERQKLIVQSDANRLMPFRNDVFDAIMCLDVLEHLENDVQLLQEMLRICVPGGIIIISVPALSVLWSHHDVALHHKRRYTKNEVLGKILNLDCKIIKASYFNSSLLLPVLIFRKIKFLLNKNRDAKSDFFIELPVWLNDALYMCYSMELNVLRLMNVPLGISFLAVVQKNQQD